MIGMVKDGNRETVSTRVGPEVTEKLQTVVDAKGVSKAEYLRECLSERLREDHDDLTPEDEIKAEIERLSSEISGDDVEVEMDDEGVTLRAPDPAGVLETVSGGRVQDPVLGSVNGDE